MVIRPPHRCLPFRTLLYSSSLSTRPIFAVTPGIFKKFYSTYHAKWVELDAPARLLVPYQHYLFYPVMSLARFNLYAQVRAISYSSSCHSSLSALSFICRAHFFLYVSVLQPLIHSNFSPCVSSLFTELAAAALVGVRAQQRARDRELGRLCGLVQCAGVGHGGVYRGQMGKAGVRAGVPHAGGHFTCANLLEPLRAGGVPRPRVQRRRRRMVPHAGGCGVWVVGCG